MDDLFTRSPHFKYNVSCWDNFYISFLKLAPFTWKKTHVRGSMHTSYYYYNYCYICTRIKAVVYVVGTAYNCTLLLGSRSAAEQNAKQKNFTISKTDSWSPQDSICTCNNREIKYNRIYRMTILHVQRNKRIHHWENERSILSFKRRKNCKIVS